MGLVNILDRYCNRISVWGGCAWFCVGSVSAQEHRRENHMVDNPLGHENKCDCAVCDDIAFRRSLPAKCFVDNDGVTDCDKLRQKVQAKHDANCLLRLLLETLPIQLEKHNLTHDRTACAMLVPCVVVHVSQHLVGLSTHSRVSMLETQAPYIWMNQQDFAFMVTSHIQSTL